MFKSYWLTASVLLFTIFIANILTGRLGIAFDMKFFPIISHIEEFIVLFIAVIHFIIYTIRLERD